MSIHRRATRVDSTQQEIVSVLVQAGFHVWHIKQPVDLLVWNPRKNAWTPMEVKSPRNKKGDPKKDKRQEAQNLFIDMTGCPVVTSPEQALEALK